MSFHATCMPHISIPWCRTVSYGVGICDVLWDIGSPIPRMPTISSQQFVRNQSKSIHRRPSFTIFHIWRNLCRLGAPFAPAAQLSKPGALRASGRSEPQRRPAAPSPPAAPGKHGSEMLGGQRQWRFARTQSTQLCLSCHELPSWTSLIAHDSVCY